MSYHDFNEAARGISDEIMSLTHGLMERHGLEEGAAFQLSVASSLIGAVERLRGLIEVIDPPKGLYN